MIKFSNFKIIAFLFVFVSVAAVSLLPHFSQAALVPCGRTDQGSMCTLCDFIVGIYGLIRYGFKIMVVIALVMIVIAGVIYIVSTGNEGMMTVAKDRLKNVLMGFAVILLAWLIISTVMWVIGTKSDLGVEAISWWQFKCK